MKYKTKTLRLKEDYILKLLDSRIRTLKELKDNCLKCNSLTDLMYETIVKDEKDLVYLINKSWIKKGILKEIYLDKIQKLKEKL